MIIPFVVGILMIVAGLWIVYFNISKSKMDDPTAAQYLTIASMFMVAGTMLVFSAVSLERIAMKLVGLGIFLAGYFLSFGFPDMGDYHPSDFDYLPFLVGFIVMSIGLYMIFFF